jgi:hypothetical protein
MIIASNIFNSLHTIPVGDINAKIIKTELLTVVKDYINNKMPESDAVIYPPVTDIYINDLYQYLCSDWLSYRFNIRDIGGYWFHAWSALSGMADILAIMDSLLNLHADNIVLPGCGSPVLCDTFLMENNLLVLVRSDIKF